MPLVIAIGIVGVALGTTAIFLLEEVRVTAAEVPEVTAGLGLGGLGLAAFGIYFLIKKII